jgi:hypothetical protein
MPKYPPLWGDDCICACEDCDCQNFAKTNYPYCSGCESGVNHK